MKVPKRNLVLTGRDNRVPSEVGPEPSQQYPRIRTRTELRDQKAWRGRKSDLDDLQAS